MPQPQLRRSPREKKLAELATLAELAMGLQGGQTRQMSELSSMDLARQKQALDEKQFAGGQEIANKELGIRQQVADSEKGSRQTAMYSDLVQGKVDPKIARTVLPGQMQEQFKAADAKALQDEAVGKLPGLLAAKPKDRQAMLDMYKGQPELYALMQQLLVKTTEGEAQTEKTKKEPKRFDVPGNRGYIEPQYY